MRRFAPDPGYGSAAPIEFAKLLHFIDDQPALTADIQALLGKKRAAPGLGRLDEVFRASLQQARA